ncbi:MAG: hypothetical protein NDI60_05775 [Elusimicrobiales bacterium]|nr:hypothetical protein [Elusimicrobiales bacterium]
MTGFAVALTAAAADPGPAADYLCAARGLGRAAAVQLLRANPGFLGRALTLEAAGALKASAAEAGLPCAVLAEDELISPPAPVKALKAAPSAAGLSVQAGGAAVFIRYEELRVLSAAAYDAPLPASDLTPLKQSLFSQVLAAAGAPVPPVPARALETFFRADLVTSEGLRILLEPENLDFSALPGRGPASLENFRLLLATISAPAFFAARNLFVTSFLAGRPLAPLKVAGPEAADLELSRLLALQKRPDAG